MKPTAKPKIPCQRFRPSTAAPPRHHARRGSVPGLFAGRIALFFLLFSLLLALPLFAGEMPRGHFIIAGTGDSQELLRRVAHDFMDRYPGITVEIPDSTGSGGGIKAVLAGTCRMARVARPLKEEEKRQGLTYLLFARAPVVFAIHPSVQGVDDLTYEQIIGIYTGRIRTWGRLGGSPDRKIYVANRETGDSSRRVLETFLPGFRNIRSLVGETLYTTPETVAILSATPFTIGYVPLSATAGTALRVPTLNGVAPTGKTIESGEYPLAIPLALVWKRDLAAEERLFVDFLLGPDGRRIIEKHGAFAAR